MKKNLKFELIRKWALYDMLARITGKRKRTISMYFYRKNLSINNQIHFLNYANGNDTQGGNKIHTK